MVRLACRRKLAVLILSLVLLAPWSAEALPLDRPLAEPCAGVVARFTELFTILLGDIGCSWDPSGRCDDSSSGEASVPGDQLDIGCSWDPNGASCPNHG